MWWSVLVFSGVGLALRPGLAFSCGWPLEFGACCAWSGKKSIREAMVSTWRQKAGVMMSTGAEAEVPRAAHLRWRLAERELGRSKHSDFSLKHTAETRPRHVHLARKIRFGIYQDTR